MIKIYKGNDEKLVTRGAYENIYKSLGYNIVIEDKTCDKNVVQEKEKKSIAQESINNKTIRLLKERVLANDISNWWQILCQYCT